MRYSIYLRAVIMTVVVFCAGVTVLSQAPGGFSFQINGMVRLADTRGPAVNAQVRLERSSGGIAGQAITDSSGKFSFSGITGQLYTVVIHAQGYKEFRQDVDLFVATTGYVSATLAVDKSAIASTPPLLHPPVLDSNVPIEAQNEYAAAKAVLDRGDTAKTNEAITHLDKAIALYPKYAEAHLARGLAYMDLKDWDRAEKSLRDVIAINPNVSTAYFALGELYVRQKKYPEAQEVLVKGVAANDAYAGGHFALADVYYLMAPTAKDETVFKQLLGNSWKEVNKTLALDPKHARAHLLAGNLLLKARKAPEALQHFEEYLKLEPKGELADQTRSMVQKIKQALAQNPKSS